MISQKYLTLIFFFISTFLYISIINGENQNPIYKYESKLKFRTDGKFKIIMFTDLHYGEFNSFDSLNHQAQNKLLDFEKPDLVILSGDMISGYNKNFFNESRYHHSWELLTKPMRDRNIPWAITFGNHDAEGSYTGSMLMDLDLSYNGSLSQHGKVYGVGAANYILPITNSKSDDIASLVYIFDSDNEDCDENSYWGCVYKEQVRWYEEQSEYYNKTPSVAFVHIPPIEAVDLWNEYEVYGDFGDTQACCYTTSESKFVDTIVERGDIKALYFGHDHRNDYHGNYKGLDLGYGRKTGYGSYDPKYPQGARVIEIEQDPFTHKTWIRNVFGDVEDQPLHKPSADQVPRICCLPAKETPLYWVPYVLVFCLVIIGFSLFQFKKLLSIPSMNDEPIYSSVQTHDI
ncbi:putative metallophosphoesterase [Heterostelium album PN500]|uniref:Putative metallophosphoesterase n=1 Tax=Heterostelium pallidum (strain ATCC 26659 / Pp 5 / PN500) TaxID=670386 RepID=D3B4M9_HETP5|nr:putative metallophosphoesterase [Heterostelium album PN500]EFA84277.1 putative metallophosphoesterase [Heterostelium album PN500]|eukprot:XP_020436393.1 putative metallophosphoesterase [Heterostelium album PN500]